MAVKELEVAWTSVRPTMRRLASPAQTENLLFLLSAHIVSWPFPVRCGIVSGILSGKICRVLFDEIYKGGDTFTQLENSCAEYGHQKEKCICSQDFCLLFQMARLQSVRREAAMLGTEAA
jgi:hypothetical protein